MKMSVVFYFCRYSGECEEIIRQSITHLNLEQLKFLAVIGKSDLSSTLNELKKISDIIFIVGDLAKQDIIDLFSHKNRQNSIEIEIKKEPLKDVINALLQNDNLQEDPARIRAAGKDERCYLLESNGKTYFIIPDDPNILSEFLKYSILPYISNEYNVTIKKFKLKKSLSI
jgi:hypothetical protein